MDVSCKPLRSAGLCLVALRVDEEGISRLECALGPLRSDHPWVIVDDDEDEDDYYFVTLPRTELQLLSWLRRESTD